MLHLLKKRTGEKSNSSLGWEFRWNCVLLQWRLSFGILPGEREFFCITIMLFITVRISLILMLRLGRLKKTVESTGIGKQWDKKGKFRLTLNEVRFRAFLENRNTPKHTDSEVLEQGTLETINMFQNPPTYYLYYKNSIKILDSAMCINYEFESVVKFYLRRWHWKLLFYLHFQSIIYIET